MLEVNILAVVSDLLKRLNTAQNIVQPLPYREDDYIIPWLLPSIYPCIYQAVRVLVCLGGGGGVFSKRGFFFLVTF